MKQINLRLDDDLYQNFRQRCEKKGLTMAGYIRSKIVETQEISEVEQIKKDFDKSIKNIKSMLNDLTYHPNLFR